MRSHNNLAVIAAAGSGKTRHIIDCALQDPTKRVLITTYTTENLNQLRRRLSAIHGAIPPNVTVMGWFSFLLSECAKPYQAAIFGEVNLIQGFDFIGRRPRRVSQANPKAYYLDSNGAPYRDEVAALAFRANERTGGRVVDRLTAIYDHIFIDEIQDMSGYDLNLIEALMRSRIGITMVGDPRQSILSTTHARKNSRYRKSRIVDWFEERKDICDMDPRVETYRCNQEICDFADGLFPELPVTVSKNTEVTGHDGIFSIRESEVHDYVKTYSPLVLRDKKNYDTRGLPAVNIGVSKGSTFDRVLIFPTRPMLEYFHSRDPETAGFKERLYVAVTRARYSATFVVPDRTSRRASPRRPRTNCDTPPLFV